MDTNNNQLQGLYELIQKTHHTQTSFKEEYLKILKDNNVEYDERYIFHNLLDD